MSNLNESILAAVQTGKKGTMNRKKIAKALSITKSMELAELGRTLDEMEEAFVLVRDEDNSYLTPEMAGFMTGKLSVNRRGLGFIDREGQDSIVVEPEDQGDALDGDMVLLQAGRYGYGKVKQVIKRAITHTVGTFNLTRHGLVCTPDDEKLAAKKTNIRYAKDFTPTEGMKVLLSFERYGTPMILRVERAIGYKDDPGVDILSILLDHDIEPEFPEEVMDNAKAVAVEICDTDIQGRKDLRNEIIVTIDGDDSKDFDDAVGVTVIPEGWNLKVNIADVSHYVTAGSELDKEAFKRGTSTYAVNTVVPMLPHILSNGICSLNPQEDRLTNTVDMIVARDGSITSYELYPSVMRSTERMTYNNVNKILKDDAELVEQYAHLGTLFTDLKDCADAIRRNRHAKGAIDFDTSESIIKTDEQGHPTEIVARVQGHAEAIIEDCMIAANVAVADYMNSHHLPCVYRIHEEPQARRMKEFEQMSFLLGHKFVLPKGELSPKEVQQYLEDCADEAQYPVLSKLLLRCMQKAKYDPKCLGHFGLAETEYLHFTSPIRRYPDLCVHRMLRKYVFEKCEDVKDMTIDETFVKDASEQSSIRERASQDAEWQAVDMKKAEYMQDRVGMRAEGIISSVTSFGFYVQLEDTVEGLVRVANLNDDFYVFDQQRYTMVGARTKKTYAIGQKVMIVVISADKDSAMIEFDIAQPKNERRSGGYSRSSSDSRGRSSYGEGRSSYGAKSSDSRGRSNGYGKSSYGSKSSDSRGSYQKKSWQSKDESGENSYDRPKRQYSYSDSAGRGRSNGYGKSSYGNKSSDSRGSYQKKSWQSKDETSSSTGENTFRKPKRSYGNGESGGHRPSGHKSSYGNHSAGGYSKGRSAGPRGSNAHRSSGNRSQGNRRVNKHEGSSH